ncbi:NAD(P)-dependent alcohol dehydrogenase [Acetilactobacillus jinshanensis]|uniref:NAD(P)-dependent alcohol dehydrogenase n=1 Tax=Acetilactobacillus jinshanensis TaxID=1720083 RepID=A0A4P6ZKJ0_9LACO|nr:NAD(P)-dependent alcohol dehydrogenase [Acetilactobacillus jinshanensis]QBP18256.1 NAD(P)-dependent alcohol dehydrogenase [Acetilactobacillus jinshanensis]
MSKKEITAAVVEKRNAPFKLEHVYIDDQPDANEVLVHIVATGICHTDETVRNGDVDGQTGVFPYPAIAGHEGAGIVEKVGSDVKNIKPGDHVVLSYAYDGTCKNCLNGHPASCLNWGKLNAMGVRANGKHAFFKKDGTPISNFFDQSSFATETMVNDRNVIKVPKSVDLTKVGPLGCGFVTGSGTVFNALKPEQGSSFVVMGTGAVGLAAMMAAEIKGCDPIIAVNHHDGRLKVAKKLGATYTINNDKVDWVKEVKKLTNGEGANYVVDTTGLTKLQEQCVAALASGGHFAPLAVTRHSMTFNPWTDLEATQKHVDGVLMGNSVPQEAIPQLIKFWQSGKFPFTGLEHYYNFDQINEANKASGNGSVVKPVMILDHSYKPGK